MTLISTVLDNIATVPIGDRVQLQQGRIDGRRVVLDGVRQMRFLGGQLGLEYDNNGTFGVMLFEGRALR